MLSYKVQVYCHNAHNRYILFLTVHIKDKSLTLFWLSQPGTLKTIVFIFIFLRNLYAQRQARTHNPKIQQESQAPPTEPARHP